MCSLDQAYVIVGIHARRYMVLIKGKVHFTGDITEASLFKSEAEAKKHMTSGNQLALSLRAIFQASQRLADPITMQKEEENN